MKKANLSSRSGRSVSVSLQYLREFSGGDDAFVRQIVNAFTQEAPALIEELRRGAKASDEELTYRMAHRLKTLYGMLGMCEQQNLALKLELSAKNHNAQSKWGSLANQLCRDTHAALPLLKRAIEEL